VSGPGAKTTRIQKRDDLGTWTDFYWSEGRKDWVQNDGTRYKGIAQARAAIDKFKLTNCTPVSHG
jgi:hypothetical protein